MISRFPVPAIDLHQDIVFHRDRPDLFEVPGQTSFAELEASCIETVVASVFPMPTEGTLFGKEALAEADRQLREYASKEGWNVIKTSSDLENGKNNLLIHLEGLNAFWNTAEDWSRLEEWYGLGLRSLGITWRHDNSCGGGNEGHMTGLTSTGEAVLRWAQEKRMLIDVAHMSDPTLADTLKVVDGPVFASHTACRSLIPSPRNLEDWQMRAIADRGGIMGIFFVTEYLTGTDKATHDDVAKHIKHAVDIAGIESVALGSDFGGIPDGTIDDLCTVRSLHRLWGALGATGFSDGEIAQIAKNNALRFMRETLPR